MVSNLEAKMRWEEGIPFGDNTTGGSRMIPYGFPRVGYF